MILIHNTHILSNTYFLIFQSGIATPVTPLDPPLVRQMIKYDKKHAGNPYQVGDSVWLYDKHRRKGRSTSNPKLSCKWQGPYLIISTLSHVVYSIQKRSRNRLVHTDRLKPYICPPLKSWISHELDDRDRESHKENGDK